MAQNQQEDSDKMSASEAGRKGGQAYHEKRGQRGSDDNTRQSDQQEEQSE